MALLLQEQHARIELGEHHLAAAALLGQIAGEQALLLEKVLELLKLAPLFLQAEAHQLDRGIRLALAALDVVPCTLKLAQIVHGERELDLLELTGEQLVLASAARLALERLELAVDLCSDVVHTRELDIHVLELATSALFALLVLEDARSLLDKDAAVLGAGLEQGLQGALRDDGMRVAAQAGVVEDIKDVHKAAGAAVDEVLAVTAAVHAARDDDLREVERERAIGVVEHEVDLREAHCLARGAAGKDDILHRLTAQLLGALLAQYPQDRVAHVGLATAVGAHDDGHPRLELEHGAIGEGFEALED